MPEVDVIRIYREPNGHYAEEVAEEAALADDEDVTVDDLARWSEQFKLSRWSEATDRDRATDESSIADRLILIGWAEAPIDREDVETHRVSYGYDVLPAVNIKVYKTELPKDGEWTVLVDEFREHMDSRLAGLPDASLRELISEFLDRDDIHSYLFSAACNDRFEQAAEDAKETFFADYRNIKVRQEGRQDGWLTISGLPDIERWSPALLTSWHNFQTSCRGLADDVPREMAWRVLADYQEELAGRVVNVTLRMVLSDKDLQEAGEDANEWDWRGMLDLSPGSTLSVEVHKP